MEKGGGKGKGKGMGPGWVMNPGKFGKLRGKGKGKGEEEGGDRRGEGGGGEGEVVRMGYNEGMIKRQMKLLAGFMNVRHAVLGGEGERGRGGGLAGWGGGRCGKEAERKMRRKVCFIHFFFF